MKPQIVRVACPKCGARLKAKAPLPEGKTLNCPACGGAVTFTGEPVPPETNGNSTSPAPRANHHSRAAESQRNRGSTYMLLASAAILAAAIALLLLIVPFVAPKFMHNGSTDEEYSREVATALSDGTGNGPNGIDSNSVDPFGTVPNGTGPYGIDPFAVDPNGIGPYDTDANGVGSGPFGPDGNGPKGPYPNGYDPASNGLGSNWPGTNGPGSNGPGDFGSGNSGPGGYGPSNNGSSGNGSGSGGPGDNGADTSRNGDGANDNGSKSNGSNSNNTDTNSNPVPPIANGNVYLVDQGQVFERGVAKGVLVDDLHGDGFPFTLQEIESGQVHAEVRVEDRPKHGHLDFNPDGSFHYTPPPDFAEADTFTYRAVDASGQSEFASVQLVPSGQGAPVDNRPRASPDTISRDSDSAVELTVSQSVLLNDYDGSGTPITIEMIKDGKIRAEVDTNTKPDGLTWNTDGSFRYDPKPGFNDDVVFVYQVVAGTSSSFAAQVVIQVKQPPSRGPDEKEPTGRSNELARLPDMPRYKQPNKISGGPTCVQMVLGYYGINTGVGPLESECNTRLLEINQWGVHVGTTFPNGIEKALKKYGVPATLKTGQSLQDILQLIDEDRSPIILVRSGEWIWHYLVVVGYINDTATIRVLDPRTGDEGRYAGDTLDGAWTFEIDLQGNSVTRTEIPCPGPGPGPGLCKEGKIRCPTCGGIGEVEVTDPLFGFKVKQACPGSPRGCGGSGESGTDCPVCFGRGSLFGDIARQLVEKASVTGHTLIAPDSPPDGTVVVPNLLMDMTFGDAKSALTERKLDFTLVGASAGTTDQLKVVDQDPPEGTRVDPKTTKVAITLEEVVAVPDVTGKSVAEATSTLQSKKLQPVVLPSEYLPGDVVLKQQVRGDQPQSGFAYAGSSVELGPLGRRVPDVTGRPWLEAFTMLSRAGLSGDTSIPETAGECVFEQKPRAGEVIDPIRPVVLTPGVHVPAVVQMTAESAQNRLASVGLYSKPQVTQTATTTDPNADGQTKVLQQNPAPPTIVPLYATVTLQVVRHVYQATPSPSELSLTGTPPRRIPNPPRKESRPPRETVPQEHIQPPPVALVEVPQVVNRTVREAVQILESRKLRAEVAVTNYRPDDVVKGQSVQGVQPKAGFAYPGSTVVLGPVHRRVPNVTGMRWDDAVAALRRVNLKAESPSGSRRTEYVGSQKPSANEWIDPANPVLLVPTPPPPTTTPTKPTKPIPVQTKALSTWAKWSTSFKSSDGQNNFFGGSVAWVRFDLSADRSTMTTSNGLRGQLVRRVQLAGEQCLVYTTQEQTITIPADGNGRGSLNGANADFQTTPPPTSQTQNPSGPPAGSQTPTGTNPRPNPPKNGGNGKSTGPAPAPRHPEPKRHEPKPNHDPKPPKEKRTPPAVNPTPPGGPTHPGQPKPGGSNDRKHGDDKKGEEKKRR